jgi:hypothetical protein
MKFTVAVLATGLLSFAAGIYMPWWWFFAVIAFLIALLVHQKPGKAFLAGFLGLFILWAGLSLWINIENKGVLAGKIAKLFPLGGSTVLLIIVTGVLAGLIAGFAALSGSFLRSAKQ